MGERILAFAAEFPNSIDFAVTPNYLQQPNLSDLPNHALTHPRYYVPPRSYPICFAGNTPVSIIGTISEEDEDEIRWGMEETTIYEVDPGELILSSTHKLFDDPRYQKDCWDTVVGVNAGVVAASEQFQILTYSCSDEPGSVELRVTPKHNFLTRLANSSSSNPETERWLRAESLAPETSLFSKGYYPDTIQQCKVTKNEAQTVIEGELSPVEDYSENELQRAIDVERNGEDLKPFFVYNLTTILSDLNNCAL